MSASSLPSTPITPNTPSGDAKPKKSNPLSDLIDTEKHYVDQLAGIIRVRVYSPGSLRSIHGAPARCLCLVALQSPAPRARYHVSKRRGCLQGKQRAFECAHVVTAPVHGDSCVAEIEGDWAKSESTGRPADAMGLSRLPPTTA